MDEWMDGWMNQNGCMDGCMDGWMDGTHGVKYKSLTRSFGSLLSSY